MYEQLIEALAALLAFAGFVTAAAVEFRLPHCNAIVRERDRAPDNEHTVAPIGAD